MQIYSVHVYVGVRGDGVFELHCLYIGISSQCYLELNCSYVLLFLNNCILTISFHNGTMMFLDQASSPL
jgi:hypothetical protein